jgi:hypothetical protein
MYTTVSKARRLPVTPEVLELSTLGRADYADAFAVDVGGARALTAEEWARAMLEGAPLRTRTTLLSGWTALGLKLAIGDPEAVLGWRVREVTPDLLLVGAGGRLGLSGELLFRRVGEELHFSTFVRIAGPAATLAWAGIEHRHDVVVRSLLERLHQPYPVEA